MSHVLYVDLVIALFTFVSSLALSSIIGLKPRDLLLWRPKRIKGSTTPKHKFSPGAWMGKEVIEKPLVASGINIPIEEGKRLGNINPAPSIPKPKDPPKSQRGWTDLAFKRIELYKAFCKKTGYPTEFLITRELSQEDCYSLIELNEARFGIELKGVLVVIKNGVSRVNVILYESDAVVHDMNRM
jgi:hypothetical protein